MSAERYMRNNNRNNSIDPIEKQVLRTSQTLLNQPQQNYIANTQKSNN